MKDAHGRYHCRPCYDRAIARQRSRAASPASSAPSPDAGAYGLEAVAPSRPQASRAAASTGATVAPSGADDINADAGPPACPSCDASLPAGTLVCVPCGINVRTGRSIVTAEVGDVDALHEHARGIFWFASWILWLGMMPIASEAHGSRKPWGLWSLVAITVLATMAMWMFQWTDAPQMRFLKSQFLWGGHGSPDAEQIELLYRYTSYGDTAAFERMKFELQSSVPRHELTVAAMNALPPSKRVIGEFRPWQLLTHAFLHDGFLHLGGNLLFMILFGSRVNALIGSLGTLLIYPLLAVAAALAYLATIADEPPIAMLGASGAIGGLAGMYLILFPVCKVHVAAFIRVPILLLGFFKCRGFWILLFFISFDVLFTALNFEDGVAHWAHLGGFMTGMAIAVLLLLTRAVNARGNDLISVLLGRHAWALLGKPSQWQLAPEGEGWLTRARLMPRSVIDEFAATFHRKEQAP